MPKKDPRQAPDTVERRVVEPGLVEINGLTMQYQVKFNDLRMVTFATTIANDCDTDDLNELFDRIHHSTEREMARIDLPKARERLVIAEAQIGMLQREYALTEARQISQHQASRKQGDFKATDQQKSELENIKKSINRFEGDIPEHKDKIRYYEQLLGIEPLAEAAE